ncbi:MAG: glycoside hydrolase [Actinomycetota bacterium]|nr:glycoside hydrolase [Actinomycetota bacterium]
MAEEGRRPPWRGITLGIGAVLLVAAVVATFWPEKPPFLIENWHVAGVDGAENAVMRAASDTSQGFVAVGHRLVDGRQEAAVWLSTDGHHWREADTGQFRSERLGEDANIELTAVGFAQQDVLAAGREWTDDESVVAIWHSPDDGETWDRLPHDPDVFGPGEITAITSRGQGRWVAVGEIRDPDRTVGQVWRSPDGFLWERIVPPVVADAAHQRLLTVTAGGPGVVAGGASEDPGTAGTTVVHTPLWTSEDGRQWEQVPDQEEPVFPAGTVIRGITTGQQATLVAVADFGPPDAQSVAAFRSLGQKADKWHTSHEIPTEEQHASMGGIVAGPEGFLVAAGALGSGDDRRAAVWLSNKGVKWELVHGSAFEEVAGARALAVASMGSRVAVVGMAGDEASPRAVAWVHGPPS